MFYIVLLTESCTCQGGECGLLYMKSLFKCTYITSHRWRYYSAASESNLSCACLIVSIISYCTFQHHTQIYTLCIDMYFSAKYSKTLSVILIKSKVIRTAICSTLYHLISLPSCLPLLHLPTTF